LMLDIILGGGITAGWYTNFGQEQTCKTTGAVTILTAALNTNVPILTYMDFEGCHTLSTVLKTNFGTTTFSEVLKRLGIPEEQNLEKQFIPVTGLQVETLGEMVNVDYVYYSGIRPITRIATDSKEFEGFAHPILTLDTDGNLVYSTLENLKVGDNIVVQDI